MSDHDRDTLILLRVRHPEPLGLEEEFTLIIEPRADHVLVVLGPFGGKGGSVAEALDELARRLPRSRR